MLLGGKILSRPESVLSVGEVDYALEGAATRVI